ncbi:hypothetical protein VT84_05210 [Gemmata sp. SH-PL17]|nr:hypothetical protein VT84_05210 [Gemmata sp. SH-PL17]
MKHCVGPDHLIDRWLLVPASERLRPRPDGRAQGPHTQPISLREPPRVSISDTHQIWGTVKPLEMKALRLFEATKGGKFKAPPLSECLGAELHFWGNRETLEFLGVGLI